MNEPLCELSELEMATIEGGGQFNCALLGAAAMTGIIAGQWWFTAGMVIAAYNYGCFC
jgi:bacteriocin-like protein